MRDERREQLEAQKEQAEHQAATQAATQAAQKQLQKRLENPDFLAQLQDPDVDSQEYDWVSNEMGPRLSGAHILGRRSEDFESDAKWANEVRQERMIAEASPGRLCKGPLLKIAQGTHRRSDVDVTERMTQDERRVLRDAHDVATNMASLSIESKGIDALTTATTVTKREKSESGTKSISERAGSLFD
jgi:multidrug efflux pump subunit AcrA (membrane-fusion protein)